MLKKIISISLNFYKTHYSQWHRQNKYRELSIGQLLFELPIVPLPDGNATAGRLILFRECLKNGIVPVVIEDVNRNDYLEVLKDYREDKSLDKLIMLFEKEQRFYFEKCKYFI